MVKNLQYTGCVKWIYCPFCGHKTRNKIRKDAVLGRLMVER